MPGSSDHTAQSSALAPTPRATLEPDSAARDTQPTGAPAHSTLPPEDPAPSSASENSLPTSEVQSTPSDGEHSTLHSASHPGSSPGSHWDERRILHLERELDQLSARERLLDKRLGDLSLRLRWLFVIGLLLTLVLGTWLGLRG